jgi:hypothetical protein
MTPAVAQPHPTHANALEAHCAALDAAAKHLEGVTFNRSTGSITGLSPASLDHIKATFPALNIAAQLSTLECWLMCNPSPTTIGQLVAERLTINARRQAKAATHKGRRMLAPHQPNQHATGLTIR